MAVDLCSINIYILQKIRSVKGIAQPEGEVPNLHSTCNTGQYVL